MTAAKMFSQYAQSERDVLVMFDQGWVKGQQEIRKAIGKISKNEWNFVTWLLVPNQQSDLETRAAFGMGAAAESGTWSSDGSKRRKKAACLSTITGKENCFALFAGPIPELGFLKPNPGGGTAGSEFFGAAGHQVLLQYNAKNKGFIQDKDKKEVLAVDSISEEDVVPLHFHMKHVTTYKELLHVLRVASMVCFSPDPNLLMACIEMRVACYAICQSSQHQEILRTFLASKVSGMIRDPSCARFYDADAAGHRQEAESSTTGGEAALVRAAANDATKHKQPVLSAKEEAKQSEQEDDNESDGDDDEQEEGSGSDAGTI
ncbi:Cacna2d3 [Symbiodinium sp. CCMP2592]|nr:Cacna2d3 [Symbiodinium sp. CCMP2592]